MLLGNRAYILQESNVIPDNIHNIKVKKSVKILGVHFSYAFQARHKLNVDELIGSIQHKLRIWKWRDLTIIGRIQIIKTFIIPIFLYRASLISTGKDFVKQVNKISIYTLSDLGVLSNLIGSLSLANEHYSPPTE